MSSYSCSHDYASKHVFFCDHSLVTTEHWNIRKLSWAGQWMLRCQVNDWSHCSTPHWSQDWLNTGDPVWPALRWSHWSQLWYSPGHPWWCPLQQWWYQVTILSYTFITLLINTVTVRYDMMIEYLIVASSNIFSTLMRGGNHDLRSPPTHCHCLNDCGLKS